MCGITGFIGVGEIEDLKKMNFVIAHRGPDDEGYVADIEARVFLAHRRLAIVDISDGYQPMWNVSKNLCVVFNGEIYNHIELRNELKTKGYIFITDHSDTEVLLHGYAEWGERLPEKLNGMWAFTIWDKSKKKLFLSRDRFGQKPLFYTYLHDFFAFSSELKALTQHRNISPEISELNLKKYFAYCFIPGAGTIYKNIFSLPAGYNLIVDLRSMKIQKSIYWEFSIASFENLPANPIEEWSERLLYLFNQAVKRRLMSDVPLGIFLSGGVDSTAIAYFANKNSSSSIDTFSIGFEELSFDESKFSRIAANYIQTKHHVDMLSIGKINGVITDILSRLNEPIGDCSSIPCWFLSRNTAKHVKVALGGDGGDELFAGYDPFRALKLAEHYNSLMPGILHKGIRMLLAYMPVSHNHMSFDFKFKRVLRGLSYPKNLWNSIWIGALEPCEINNLTLSRRISWIWRIKHGNKVVILTIYMN